MSSSYYSPYEAPSNPDAPKGSWAANRHPEKQKCPWRVGQNVYLVSNIASRQLHQYTISLDDLGQKYKITSIFFGGYSPTGRLVLKNHKTGKTDGTSAVHQDDLSKENTFVHPFSPRPGWLERLKGGKFIGDCSHEAHYAMYIANKKNDESWEDLMSDCNSYYYEDACDDCFDGDCDNCDRRDMIHIDPKLSIPGLVNSNTSCWGDGMDIWDAVRVNFKNHPTRMALLLPEDDVYDSGGCGYDGSYERPAADIFKDIQKFIGYMKEGKVLPPEIKVPTDDMKGNDLIFKINLEQITPNRMYWYFCTLRAPVQFPGIVPLTVRFIEEEGFEPLLAYIMAQVVCPHFYGGHAVVEPNALRLIGGYWRQPSLSDNGNYTQIFYPDMEAVLRFAVRCQKFLTTNTGTYVTEAGAVHQWSLNRHLLFDVCKDPNSTWNRHNKDALDTFHIRFKTPKGLSSENISSFSVSKRKLLLEGGTA